MFPIIPILAIAAILGGIATLSWYSELTEEEKIKANKRMNELALKLFRQNYNLLAEGQKKIIDEKVKKEIEESRNS